MKRKIVSTLAMDAPLPLGKLSKPHCEHGEALRFYRTDKSSGIVREFYACSANRDRKVCSLFYWVDDWERKLRKAGESGMNLATPAGSGSRVKKSRDDDSLGVNAFVDNSTNAQFLFDKDSISLISQIILDFTSKSRDRRVLSIGTPSIHKELLNSGVSSVLLDEDARLTEVLPNTQRFNVFNGECYGFALPEDDFDVIVIDPPFHPELVPALFRTVAKCFPVSFKGLILFAFPYFNSPQVISACPSLHMSDVRLTYRNHAKYKTAERSPVRLFSSFKIGNYLRSAQGYTWCEKCDDLKHSSNKHCEICSACTTIAGPTPYVHCQKCSICVKPNASHCDECGKCFISDHPHTRDRSS
jgi:hypothetical protein